MSSDGPPQLGGDPCTKRLQTRCGLPSRAKKAPETDTSFPCCFSAPATVILALGKCSPGFRQPAAAADPPHAAAKATSADAPRISWSCRVSERSVRATRAAARGPVFGGLALGHLEGVAAAAGGGHVRVRDLEAGLLDRLQEVDLGAAQVGRAEGIDDHRDAVGLDLVVALLGAAVEAQRVLEAGAAAALDGDAQNGRLALGLLDRKSLDLGGRALGEHDQLVGSLDDLHAAIDR